MALGVSRFRLDATLSQAAAAAGAVVLEEVTGTAVQWIGGGYQIDAHDGDGMRFRIKARTAAVACGRAMVPGLRPHLATGVPGRRFVGIKHFDGVQLPPEVRLYFFEGGYAGLSPIGSRADAPTSACWQPKRLSGEGASASPPCSTQWPAGTRRSPATSGPPRCSRRVWLRLGR